MEIDPAEFTHYVEMFQAYMLEILREAQADDDRLERREPANRSGE